MDPVIFYPLAGLTLLSALLVITVHNPVHAVLWLVMAFIGSAGIWLTLHAEFLAIALVLVYVGAVMVLFLFVVMMLDIDPASLNKQLWKSLPLAGIAAGATLWVLYQILYDPRFINATVRPLHPDLPASNTQALGWLLYTHYVYAVEIVAVILLVAMVAAIALTMRLRKTSRALLSAETQNLARKSERLRLVHKPAVSADKAVSP